VDVQVYQGDDDDALKNILVADFRIEGLTPTAEPNEVLCRMRLDLDGILEVTAVEKRTGKSKQIAVANALRAKSAEEIAAARQRIRELYESRSMEYDEATDDPADMVIDAEAEPVESSRVVSIAEGRPGETDRETENLLERSRRLLEGMHADDREEAIGLHETIQAAMESGDDEALRRASRALGELLFFIEGKA
jgi:molecular chaperone DnaK